MCSDCKRHLDNGGNCSGKPNTCVLFVDKDLPDLNPVVFGNNNKKVGNRFETNTNS